MITGQGAQSAGTGVVLSFALASLCCLFSAFSYAEFAARVPISGSAYTFTYVCLGEFIAWFVGWNLTLEYSISAAAVARGWASNVVLFFRQAGVDAPDWLDDYDVGFTSLSPLSLLICLICMVLLISGAKESARINLVVTIMNVCLILFIIILGSFHIDPENWTKAPGPNDDTSGCHGSHTGLVPCGFNGILKAAAQVFFSFIGFDSVTTLSEEVQDAKKDIPFGVVGTLGIVTILYVGAALVVTGMVPWFLLNSNTPLASAFTTVGVSWATTMIAALTVTALTVTTLTSLYGQPRIFYRMARDGLLFKRFGDLNAKTQTPVFGTLATGIGAALIALFIDLDALSQMISIGTLIAFSTVCAGVIILRYDVPDRPSYPVYLLLLFLGLAIGGGGAFQKAQSIEDPGLWLGLVFLVLMIVPAYMLSKLPLAPMPSTYACPYVPWLPLMGIFSNVYLICSLNWLSYVRMAIWTLIGFSIYFFYGIKYSKLNPTQEVKPLLATTLSENDKDHHHD